MAHQESTRLTERTAVMLVFALFVILIAALPWLAMLWLGPAASAVAVIVLGIAWAQLIGAPRPFCRGMAVIWSWAVVCVSLSGALVVAVGWLMVHGVRMMLG